MILFFPQWQGIGFPTSVTDGAQRLLDALQNKTIVDAVDVTPKHDIDIEHGVFGHTEIYAQLTQASTILRNKKPKHVLTIGGDCGVEVAPSAYLNDLYNGDVQLFWLDAHADINTPDTSFSGHFHGMPIGYLLGEVPDDPISQLITKPMIPEQIAFIGLRSIDPPEDDYIKNHGIEMFEFKTFGSMKKKYKHAIVHIDTDVLDAGIYRECSTPTTGGTDPETLIRTVSTIFEQYDVVGATITEYAPGTKGSVKPDEARPMIERIFKEGLRANDALWAI